jgi:hypothetical protein
MRFVMNISDFINTNYNIVYKGVNVNIENFSTIDAFLLGDNHKSAGHSVINSLFINTFSNKEDIVLVEAIRSMQRIEKDDALQSVWLTTQSQIMGWDVGTPREITGSTLLQQMGNLEKKFQILQRQLLDPNFIGNKEEVKSELAGTMQKIGSLLPGLMTQGKYLVAATQKTLTGRIKSMNDSLIEAKKISSRTFLIAATKYLQQENTRGSSFSLDNFHEFLNTRNFVVLFPKPEKAWELGQKRDLIINEALKAVT